MIKLNYEALSLIVDKSMQVSSCYCCCSSSFSYLSTLYMSKKYHYSKRKRQIFPKFQCKLDGNLTGKGANGYGKMYQADGTTIEGTFYNGDPSGYVIKKNKRGFVFFEGIVWMGYDAFDFIFF